MPSVFLCSLLRIIIVIGHVCVKLVVAARRGELLSISPFLFRRLKVSLTLSVKQP